MPRLMLSYLTRTGTPDHRGVAATNPELLTWAARLLPGADWAASRPSEAIASSHLPLGSWSLPTRLVREAEGRLQVEAIDVPAVEAWTPPSQAVVDRAGGAVRGGADLVLLRGGPGPDALLDRLALAEQVRLVARVPVAVEGLPDQLDDIALGVLAGRADAAVLRGALP